MGEVGLAYTPVTILASGGNTPYLWRISDGALPGGLAISADGVISGTPTAKGSFGFTMEVMDAALATANAVGAMTIAPRLAVYPIGALAKYNVIEVCTEPRADHPCPTPDYKSDPFGAVSGGAAPYTYSVVSGALPAGTVLNGLALTWVKDPFGTGFASYTFTVAVTDSLGASASLTVDVHLYRM